MKNQGIAHVYGDHIDTDVIIPARVLNDPSLENLAAHCMEDIDPAFTAKAQQGDMIVGGVNFGCGSSREHAPLAIKAVGISCVIAKSFARIFYRNAVNIGLPVLECPQAAAEIQPGDQLSVDLSAGMITNLTQGKEYRAAAFPPFMQGIIDAGGLVAYTKRQVEESAQ